MKPGNSLPIILLFMAISFQGYGQENNLLKGKIMADSLDGASIHIINLSKNSGTTSSPQGDFEINVSIDDTISFSSIQFEEHEVVIKKRHLEEGYLLVKLAERTNELEEVYLSNNSLTGNLEVDISNIRIFDPSLIGFAFTKPLTIEERRLNSAKSGTLNHLFNQFSGKTANLENIVSIEKQKGMAQKGIKAFKNASFTNHLEIPENCILDFIYYCMENPNFHILLLPQRGLELIEYYQMKAPKYLKTQEGKLKKV